MQQINVIDSWTGYDVCVSWKYFIIVLKGIYTIRQK